jgi:hypothetical protein
MVEGQNWLDVMTNDISCASLWRKAFIENRKDCSTAEQDFFRHHLEDMQSRSSRGSCVTCREYLAKKLRVLIKNRLNRLPLSLRQALRSTHAPYCRFSDADDKAEQTERDGCEDEEGEHPQRVDAANTIFFVLIPKSRARRC